MRRILPIFERALLGVGIACLLVYGAAAAHARLGSAWDRFAFHRVAQGQPATVGAFLAHVVEPEDEILVEDPPDTADWSADRVRAWEETRTSGGKAPVGLLEIPSVGLEVAVLDGTDEWALNRGVGHIEGTARPGELGNVGIAGHRDGFFRALRKLQPGETIHLQTLEGRYEYRVDEIEIVLPNETEVLDTAKTPSLTLVTCYPFYYVGNAPQRYIVKAELVQAVE